MAFFSCNVSVALINLIVRKSVRIFCIFMDEVDDIEMVVENMGRKTKIMGYRRRPAKIYLRVEDAH